jgi:hypothetical protein
MRITIAPVTMRPRYELVFGAFLIGFIEIE